MSPMDFASTVLEQFNTYAKANPVVAGLAGLFGMSVISFILIKVPKQVWQFAERQCTTSLTFNNGGDGCNLETFGLFLEWFQDNHWKNMVRSYAIDGVYGNSTGTVVGVGPGRHFFTWKGRFFYLRRENFTQQAMAGKIMSMITITMLGRNRKLLLDMIEEFRYKPKPNTIGIFRYGANGWIRVADIDKRGLDTVFVDEKVLTNIMETYEWFRDNKPWYQHRGFPYKLTMLFHGKPGNGKTSLIKALASHYDMNLCLINLASMSDSSLEAALASAPRKSFITMEDFDSAPATQSRVLTPMAAEDSTPTLGYSDSSFTVNGVDIALPSPAPANSAMKKVEENLFGLGLTLAGLLNALDGLLSLDGRVIILTTNYIKQMDEALLRKGRIDLTEEIKELNDALVRRYILHMFPDYSVTMLDLIPTFAPILGCNIQALYLNHHDDADGFVRSLPLKTIEDAPSGSNQSRLRAQA